MMRAAATTGDISRIVLVLLTTLVVACSARPRPQVSEQSIRQPETVVTRVPEYAVARGDTLYGIAFRLGVDYRDLARWNEIHPPYTIYPGQRLQVEPSTAVSAKPTERVGVASTAPLPDSRSAVVTAPLASQPRTTTPGGVVASSAGAAAPAQAATRAPAPVASAPTKAPPAPSASSAGSGGIAWRWPVSGQLLSTFAAGDQLRQGIDIVGTAGTPVQAAAAGEVVYSGSGLVGYGELIIIKHNDTWLSAYGHNRKRLVSEGAQVSAGQTIGEMGRTGASRDMLHFEIRKNGKPVDPLPLLPRR